MHKKIIFLNLNNLIKLKAVMLYESYYEEAKKKISTPTDQLIKKKIKPKEKCHYCGSDKGFYANDSTGGWLACTNCGGI